jgi:type IV pilus assembly protein PilM
LRPQSFREALERLVGAPAQQRRTAALVIPDYAVRMAVLDFQEFPAAEAERTALLRFRLRKSVPFHIDEASVSYAVQTQEAKNTEVLAVAIARPILEEYERLFIDHGFRVGLVTPSLLAAVPLLPPSNNGLTLVMKGAGGAVAVLLIQGTRVRLVRSVDLSQPDVSRPDEEDEVQNGVHADELLALVQQMAAYAEDQLGDRIGRVLVCGLKHASFRELLGRELDVPVEQVRSRFGEASQYATGLLGLLEQYPS